MQLVEKTDSMYAEHSVAKMLAVSNRRQKVYIQLILQLPTVTS